MYKTNQQINRFFYIIYHIVPFQTSDKETANSGSPYENPNVRLEQVSRCSVRHAGADWPAEKLVEGGII